MHRSLAFGLLSVLAMAACAPSPTRPGGGSAAPAAPAASAPQPVPGADIPAAAQAAGGRATLGAGRSQPAGGGAGSPAFAPAIAMGSALAAEKALGATPRGGPHRSGAWRLASKPGAAKASSGPAEAAVDGDGETEWNPRAFVAPGAPQWLALPLAAPAAGTLAVAWHGHALHYVNYDYGRPRTYEIEASSDSTDGADGTWRTVAAIDENQVRSRTTVFEAKGATWIRLRFLTAWSGVAREPFLREAAVYERTAEGAPDTWLVMGDSTTSVGLDPAKPPHLAQAVAESHPGRLPIAMSGGTGGDTAAHAMERLAVALPTLPAGSLVGLCYGSNDAKHHRKTEDYRRDLQAAIDAIRRAGHDPLVAVVPWSLNGDIASYARVCREVAKANGLPPGPDFFEHFQAHPEELEHDKVHPNAAGIRSMQRLWAEAGAFRYE